MQTWTRNAIGSPDEVRHVARKWANGSTGIEAVQVAVAEQVVDQLSKQFPDLVQHVQVPPSDSSGKDGGKVELPVKRTELNVLATGEYEKDKSGSITVSYSLQVPQRDARMKIAAGGKSHDLEVVDRSGAGVGP